MSARFRVARRVSRSFIAQSDGRLPRLPRRLRIRGVSLAQDLPARPEGAPDQFLRALHRFRKGSTSRARYGPGCLAAAAAHFKGFFQELGHNLKIGLLVPKGKRLLRVFTKLSPWASSSPSSVGAS